MARKEAGHEVLGRDLLEDAPLRIAEVDALGELLAPLPVEFGEASETCDGRVGVGGRSDYSVTVTSPRTSMPWRYN